MKRQSFTSNPPSAVCAGFFYQICQLLYTFDPSLTMQLSTPGIKIPSPWVPIGLCMPSLPHLPKIVYEDLSRGLKAKHMLKGERLAK